MFDSFRSLHWKLIARSMFNTSIRFALAVFISNLWLSKVSFYHFDKRIDQNFCVVVWFASIVSRFVRFGFGIDGKRRWTKWERKTKISFKAHIGNRIYTDDIEWFRVVLVFSFPFFFDGENKSSQIRYKYNQKENKNHIQWNRFEIVWSTIECGNAMIQSIKEHHQFSWSDSINDCQFALVLSVKTNSKIVLQMLNCFIRYMVAFMTTQFVSNEAYHIRHRKCTWKTFRLNIENKLCAADITA